MTKTIQVVVGSIVAVGALSCCSLFNPDYDLKATLMDLLRNLVPDLILYEFKLGLNPAWVASTWMTWKRNLSQKLWIPRPCLKLYKQTPVCQLSSAFHNPLGFVIFTTPAKSIQSCLTKILQNV